MTPAPRTMSRGGSVSRAKTVSLVRAPTASRPGIGAPPAASLSHQGPGEPERPGSSIPCGHLDGIPRDEGATAEEDVHAGIPQAHGPVVRGDVGTDVAHALHGRRKVHRDLTDLHPESPGITGRMGRGRHTDERLRWNAARVQAISSQQRLLDQGHPSAHGRRSHGRHQARGSAADHHEVVAPAGSGQGQSFGWTSPRSRSSWALPGTRPSVLKVAPRDGRTRLDATVGVASSALPRPYRLRHEERTSERTGLQTSGYARPMSRLRPLDLPTAQALVAGSDADLPSSVAFPRCSPPQSVPAS